MNNFVFHNPTKVVFGRDTTDKLAGLLKGYGNNILLVYGGGSIKKSGLYDKVKAQLTDKSVTELSGVDPNPRLTTVYKGIKKCKEKDIDFILAVGGGSVIDCAKAISIGAKYDGDVWDFFKGKAYPTESIPIGTVLTLVATGSEMNGNAVITNMDTKEKIGFAGVLLMHPQFSILDPLNTFTVPKNQIANGCADIIAHVMEDYFSWPDDTPIQDGMAETIIKTTFDNTLVALQNPEDYNARANLMWCGTLALNYILSRGKEGDWSMHGIEHCLSAHYDIAHGAGLSIIMAPYMKKMCAFNPAKYRQYAINVFNVNPKGKTDEQIAHEGIELTKNLLSRIGCPVSLAEVDIDEEKLEQMAEEITQDGDIGGYGKIGKEELLKILEESL